MPLYGFSQHSSQRGLRGGDMGGGREGRLCCLQRMALKVGLPPSPVFCPNAESCKSLRAACECTERKQRERKLGSWKTSISSLK